MRRGLVALVLLGLVSVGEAQIRIERMFWVNQTIPDCGQYVSSVVISNAGIASITDVNVALSFSSPAADNAMWLGDLYVTLTHGLAWEDERVAVLLNRAGRSTNDWLGSDLSSLDITLDDSLAVPSAYSISSPTGTYQADGRIGVDPYGNPVAYNAADATNGLSSLNGAWLASNRWSLLVADTEMYSLARLNSWRLTISGIGADSGTLDPGAGGTISDAGTNNAVGAVVMVDGSGTNGVTTRVTNSLVLNAGLQGSGDIFKEGGGTLTIGGNSTNFSGTMSVKDGAVEVASANAIGDGSLVLAGTNTKLTLVGGIQFSAPVTLATNGVRFDGAGSIAGAMDGIGGLTKIGEHTLVLSGSNSFAGATTISNGTLSISSDRNLGAAPGSSTAGHLTLDGGKLLVTAGMTLDANRGVSLGASGGIFEVTNDQSLAYGGGISGSGVFTKSGTGTMVLSGPSSFTGGTVLQEGFLRLASVTAAGTGQITQSSGSSTLLIDAGGTFGNAMSLYNIRTLQSVTLSGNKTLHNATYTIDAGNTTTDSGDLSGTGGVTKEGVGTLILTGNNSFTGAVSVNAGLLKLDSSSGGAAAAASSLSVTGGATLLVSQSNQVNDTASVSLSGGTIQRASGVSEAFGNLSVTSSSILDFGTGTTGVLSFGTYTPSALLTVQNFFQGNVLTFNSNLSSTISNGSLFSFDNGVTSSWNNSTSTFTITAIPEPSSLVALAGVLGFLFLSSLRIRIRFPSQHACARRGARNSRV